MKVFIDANVLVSVLNKEYPLFTYTSRILSLADSERFTLFTSPICLAIAYYFSEKKSGAKKAKAKIQVLVSKIKTAVIDDKAVLLASRNKAILDFEDGLEYYGALNAGCDFIITEDITDFYFSDIMVIKSGQFLERFVTKQ